jgi:hypothetical protein
MKKKKTAVAVVERIFVRLGRQQYEVASLREASERWSAARDAFVTETGYGASQTPTAIIVDGTGKRIGYISYNGRVMPGRPQTWTPDTQPLYDPYAELIRNHEKETPDA